MPWPEELGKPSSTAVRKTVGIDAALNSLYRQINAYVCFPPLVISKNERLKSTIQPGWVRDGAIQSLTGARAQP
jgi:hypothetical protein